MRTKRLVALIPFSFFLFVTVQFLRPKQPQNEQFDGDKFQEERILEPVVFPKRQPVERRKINLHLLKTQFRKNSKADEIDDLETFPNGIINYPKRNFRLKMLPTETTTSHVVQDAHLRDQDDPRKNYVQSSKTLTAENLNEALNGAERRTFTNELINLPDVHRTLETAKVSSHEFWDEGNPTIVTAIIDIGRGIWDHYRRPYEMYQDFMKPLLSLDVHLYIFADRDGANFVQKHRNGYLNKTVIHVVGLEDLPYYQFFPHIRNIIAREQAQWNDEWEPAMKTHPEAFSSEYILLMNSKAHFVREASSRNPFRSEHFYWLDAGYGHGHTNYPRPGASWAPRNIMIPDLDSKVTFMKLRSVKLENIDLKQLYRKDVALIVGSFFGGSSRAISSYHDIYNSTFFSLLTNNHVDDDQSLTVLCYQTSPNLFNFVDGDWYDVFVLFG